MATEETSRDPTTSTNKRNDLEALSLNYLRSQNISQIFDDDHIPKLHPCRLCSKAMFGFQFEALTILRCGHLLHRLCVETHIMRGATKFPSCPICKVGIEINREELGLASGECFLTPRLLTEKGGKASQESNVTIDDSDGGLEEMLALGLIRDESSEQVSKEDRGTSPIANISVTTHEQATSPIPDNSTSMYDRATTPFVIEYTSSTQEDSGNQANENFGRVTSPDESNTNIYVAQDSTKGSKSSSHSVTASGNSKDQTNDITKTRSSRQSSSKIDRDQNKLQGLLRELSTPIKGESTKDNEEDEDSESSLSKGLARLYQKAIKAEKRVTQAYQEEILCWYYYAERFEKSVKEITDNNREISDKTARGQVYDTIIPHLTGITKENLRKKTQKARTIFTLFSKIGLQKIKRIQSYSADSISKLTGDQIKSIIKNLRLNYTIPRCVT